MDSETKPSVVTVQCDKRAALHITQQLHERHLPANFVLIMCD